MRAGYGPATPRVESWCTQSNRAIAAAAYLFSFSIFGPTKDNPPRHPFPLRRASTFPVHMPSRTFISLTDDVGGRRWSARAGPWSFRGIRRTTGSGTERERGGQGAGAVFWSCTVAAGRRLALLSPLLLVLDDRGWVLGSGSLSPREHRGYPRSENLRLTWRRSAYRSLVMMLIRFQGGVMLWTAVLTKYAKINRPFDASSETGEPRYTRAYVVTGNAGGFFHLLV